MAIANLNTADYISGNGVTQDENVISITGGSTYLFISANEIWGRTTNGAAEAQRELSTSIVNIKTLNFDHTTQEFGQYQTVLPWSSGGLNAKVYWTATGGTPGQTVRWGIKIGFYTNNDALTTALGSVFTVDDVLIVDDDLHITSSIEIGNIPASEELFFLQIQRNTSDDDLSVDAELIGILLTIGDEQVAPVEDTLLMEDSGNILMEDSGNILTE